MQKITKEKAIEMRLDVIISGTTRVDGSLETDQIWEDNSVIGCQNINTDNWNGSWDDDNEEINEIYSLGTLGDYGDTKSEAIQNLKQTFEFFKYNLSDMGSCQYVTDYDSDWDYYVSIDDDNSKK